MPRMIRLIYFISQSYSAHAPAKFNGLLTTHRHYLLIFFTHFSVYLAGNALADLYHAQARYLALSLSPLAALLEQRSITAILSPYTIIYRAPTTLEIFLERKR